MNPSASELNPGRPMWWFSGWLMLGCLILLQGIRFATFYSLEGHVDISFQLHAAANLEAGFGYTLSEVKEANLDNIQYAPLIGWPPGYSVLALTMKKLTGDWLIAARFIRGLALLVVLLLGAWLWKMIRGDRLHGREGWILVALYGLNFAPFYYPEVTGLICFALLLLATGAWLRSQQASKPWPWLVLASVAMGLTPWFRFAYLPLLAILPATMLWLGGGKTLLGFFQKKTAPIKIAWLRKGGVSALIELLLFLPLYLHQQAQTGALSHLAYRPKVESLDLGKLLHFDPFPVKAFLYADPSVVADRYGEGLGLLANLGFAFCSLAVLLVLVVKLWRKPDRLRIPAFMLLGIPVLMLTYLSLRYPYEGVLDGGVWTYVQETRYYLPAMLVIHLVFLSFLLDKGKLGMLVLAGIICLVGLRYGVRHYQHYGLGINNQTQISEFDTRLRQLIQLKKGIDRPTFYVFDEEERGWREEIRHYVAPYGYTPFALDALEKNFIQYSGPAVLILHIKPEQKGALEKRYPSWIWKGHAMDGYRQIWQVDLTEP